MKFLHFGFTFHETAKAKELEPTFDAAEDWIRYAPNCWIVKTAESPDWWADKLKAQVAQADGFVIVEIDPRTRWGFAQKWVWDWFDKAVE